MPCAALDRVFCDGSEVRDVLGYPLHHPQESLALQSLPVSTSKDRSALVYGLGKLRQGELGEAVAVQGRAEPGARAHPCSIPVPHQDEDPSTRHTASTGTIATTGEAEPGAPSEAQTQLAAQGRAKRILAPSPCSHCFSLCSTPRAPVKSWQKPCFGFARPCLFGL